MSQCFWEFSFGAAGISPSDTAASAGANGIDAPHRGQSPDACVPRSKWQEGHNMGVTRKNTCRHYAKKQHRFAGSFSTIRISSLACVTFPSIPSDPSTQTRVADLPHNPPNTNIAAAQPMPDARGNRFKIFPRVSEKR
jgi:hypothetical protein